MDLGLAFRDAVIQQRPGWRAACVRALLGAVEPFYASAMRLRNRRYDRGQATIHRVGAPVISVGNLTLGGTGKSPVVAWLAEWLCGCGRRPAIVSRGYKQLPGDGDGRNDEARELATRMPQVPHVQSPDRVAASRKAIAEHRADVILLDDGFQHRRLHRDLDIVLLDALAPWGNGHVFPRGALREPAAGLSRADMVVLSRADQVRPEQAQVIQAAAAQMAPQALWAEAIHAARGLRSVDGDRRPLESLVGRRAAAFCGLGNPAGFRHTLERCGLAVVGFREYPDHHAYSDRDRDELASWATAIGADTLLCTGKDLVKIEQRELGQTPVWAVEIAIRWQAGQSALEERLKGLLW